MTSAMRLTIAAIALLWASLAAGQSTLGALLDADARKLSPGEFNEELVQRTIVGLSPTGGRIEMMYASNGTIHGVATNPAYTSTMPPEQGVGGEWRIDDKERICTSLRIGLGGGGPAQILILPTRCQYLFKLGDRYFFADSDSDRLAKVQGRTIKQ